MEKEVRIGQMNPTPLERAGASFFRGGFVAFGASLTGLLVYALCGAVFVTLGMLDLSYPFLVVSQDPAVLFLLSASGLFLSISMTGWLLTILLSYPATEEVVIPVILASTAVGFGIATFVYSVSTLLRLVR